MRELLDAWGKALHHESMLWKLLKDAPPGEVSNFLHAACVAANEESERRYREFSAAREVDAPSSRAALVEQLVSEDENEAANA